MTNHSYFITSPLSFFSCPATRYYGQVKEKEHIEKSDFFMVLYNIAMFHTKPGLDFQWREFIFLAKMGFTFFFLTKRAGNINIQ